MSDLSVWYLLVDSQGNNYQGYNVFFVELKSSAMIGRFLLAIKSQNSDINCSPRQLKVYRDKNSLNNIPLEPDTLLENISTSAKNPLLVVVRVGKLQQQQQAGKKEL